jgi:hypothetical protein
METKQRSLSRCFNTDLDAVVKRTVRAVSSHAVLLLTEGFRSHEMTS